MSEARNSAARAAERIAVFMHETTPVPSRQAQLEGRARLIAAVDRMRRPRSAARSLSLALLGVATAAAASGFFYVRAHTPAPIAWHVENGPVGTENYVSIPPGAPTAHLVFDDGSNVALMSGSRGRVATTTPVGAEVVLEQGQAHVHVAHHERTSWLVDAGPFAVRVTGTDFFVAWAADAETLDVWMKSGRVVVKGPVLGDAQPLSSGQHMRASLREATVQIDSAPAPSEALGASAPAATAPAEAIDSEGESAGVLSARRPIAAVQPPEPPAGANPPPPVPGSAVAAWTWSRLVAGGEFARVIREAEGEGVGRAVAVRPLADLRALGDAARYQGNATVARAAFKAIRSRFPASGEARTAAFLMGRVAEEQDQATEEALRWYDRYLAEAPGGEFAGNALGRKMILISKLHGRDAARPLANRYLQRFPSGPYAAAARDLAP